MRISFFLVFLIICMYDENRKLSSDKNVFFASYSFNQNISPVLAILSWIASFSLNISRKLRFIVFQQARAVFHQLYTWPTLS